MFHCSTIRIYLKYIFIVLFINYILSLTRNQYYYQYLKIFNRNFFLKYFSEYLEHTEPFNKE